MKGLIITKNLGLNELMLMSMKNNIDIEPRSDEQSSSILKENAHEHLLHKKQTILE